MRAYDRVRGALGTGAVGVGVDVVDGGFVGGCVVQAMWSQGLRCVIPSVQVSSVRVQGSGTFGSDELVSLESVLLSGLTLEGYRYRYRRYGCRDQGRLEVMSSCRWNRCCCRG